MPRLFTAFGRSREHRLSALSKSLSYVRAFDNTIPIGTAWRGIESSNATESVRTELHALYYNLHARTFAKIYSLSILGISNCVLY